MPKKSEEKNELKNEVKNEVKNEFNINDYKPEIDSYIKERVDKEASSSMVKFYKKRLRNKNVIIIIDTIIIIVLILFIVYSVCFLYYKGYLNNLINNNNNNTEDVVKKDEQQDNTKSLEELSKKYSYLIDKVKIDVNSDYLADFYEGNLTPELKEYLSYRLIDDKKIITDDLSTYFDASVLKEAYNQLFNDNLQYKTFKYDGSTFKYIESKDMFISFNKPQVGANIEREIIDIKEDNGNVIIKTVEGYFNDNKLFNIKNDKEVIDYKKDDKLSIYSKKLNVVSYSFKNEYLSDLK